MCYLKKAKMDDTETKENIFIEVQSSQKQINSIQCHIRPHLPFQEEIFLKNDGCDIEIYRHFIYVPSSVQNKFSFVH